MARRAEPRLAAHRVCLIVVFIVYLFMFCLVQQDKIGGRPSRSAHELARSYLPSGAVRSFESASRSADKVNAIYFFAL